MERVITQINAKTEKGFSPVAYPIGSSAKYIKTKYVNPDTGEEEVTNLQNLLDTKIVGGKIYWMDRR